MVVEHAANRTNQNRLMVTTSNIHQRSTVSRRPAGRKRGQRLKTWKCPVNRRPAYTTCLSTVRRPNGVTSGRRYGTNGQLNPAG